MPPQPTKSKSGSHWNRWDPHIHAPGTILNDQFKGPDSWDRYLDAIENTTPPMRALGITDYYSIETYHRVMEANFRRSPIPPADLKAPVSERPCAISSKGVSGRSKNAHAACASCSIGSHRMRDAWRCRGPGAATTPTSARLNYKLKRAILCYLTLPSAGGLSVAIISMAV
jgi:hypothetical protein